MEVAHSETPSSLAYPFRRRHQGPIIQSSVAKISKHASVVPDARNRIARWRCLALRGKILHAAIPTIAPSAPMTKKPPMEPYNATAMSAGTTALTPDLYPANGIGNRKVNANSIAIGNATPMPTNNPRRLAENSETEGAVLFAADSTTSNGLE